MFKRPTVLFARYLSRNCYCQERERTDLEIELLQLKESLAQQQLQGHHHNAHHHHHHNHHAPHPPVLPLSGRRLLPDADHEVGFGADEVRHALYGMGKKLRRQVGVT